VVPQAGNTGLIGVPANARPLAFGHFGDGNVHDDISQPIGMPKANVPALWQPMQQAINATALDLGGSISAEHGIGIMKREALRQAKSPVALALMRAIKRDSGWARRGRVGATPAKIGGRRRAGGSEAEQLGGPRPGLFVY